MANGLFTGTLAASWLPEHRLDLWAKYWICQRWETSHGCSALLSGPYLERANLRGTLSISSHKLKAFGGCCTRIEVVINTKLLSVTKQRQASFLITHHASPTEIMPRGPYLLCNGYRSSTLSQLIRSLHFTTHHRGKETNHVILSGVLCSSCHF